MGSMDTPQPTEDLFHRSRFRITAGPTTISDCHSLLRMLCPDFPLGAVKNAWNTALAIYMETVLGSKAASVKKQTVCMPFSNFFTSLEITFTYERFLMVLRKKHFDSSKRCTSFEDLCQSLQLANKWADTSGWPVPSPIAVEKSISEASKGGEDRAFEFRNLVKALSCCEDVQEGLKENHHLLELARDNCQLRTEGATPVPRAVASDRVDKSCDTPKTRKKSAKVKAH